MNILSSLFFNLYLFAYSTNTAAELNEAEFTLSNKPTE